MSGSSGSSVAKSSKKHRLSRLLNNISLRIHRTSSRKSSKHSKNSSLSFETAVPIKQISNKKGPPQFDGSSTSNSESRSFLFDNNEVSQDGLKVLKEIKECPLCFRDLPLQSFPVLSSCSHRSCLQCLQQYLKIEITESRVNLSCPVCTEPIQPNEIYMILNDEFLREKYETFMLRRVLVTETEARWCPFPDCGYAVIASGCADCPKIKCGRPRCNTFFCYHCREEWHPNQTCEAARALRTHYSTGQNNIGHGDIKRCPRCRVLIVKVDDGSCNRMKCDVCGTQFCWLCMKEISGLHYFSSSGCTYFGKKPWSRKKKIMWQLGMLVGGAPVGIALIAGFAVPAIIIGVPLWVGLKLHARYARVTTNKNRRKIIIASGVLSSFLVSPIIAGVTVGVGVPLSFFFVYVAVPVLLSVYGNSGDLNDRTSVSQQLTNKELASVNPAIEKESTDDVSDYTSTRTLEVNPRTDEGSISRISSLSLGCEKYLDRIAMDYNPESASSVSLTGSIVSPSLTEFRELEVRSDLSSKRDSDHSEAGSVLDNTKRSLAELLAATILGQRCNSRPGSI